MKQENFLLINRKPQKFQEVMQVGSGWIFRDAEGKPLNHGVLVMNQDIRICLYCDEVRNITFLEARPGDFAIKTVIFGNEDDYKMARDGLQRFRNLEISPQNKKINRYAERLMELLRDGREIRVVDAVRKEDVLVCPECGMQSPLGSPYCMECGASLE